MMGLQCLKLQSSQMELGSMKPVMLKDVLINLLLLLPCVQLLELR